MVLISCLSRVADFAVIVLNRWLSGHGRRRRSVVCCQDQCFVPEALESRALLTSVGTIPAAGAPVVVSGTTGDDIFYVAYSGSTVSAVATVKKGTLGNAPQLVGTYPITTQLSFSGLWGNDVVQITGTSAKDLFVVSGVSVKTNTAQITNSSIENIELIGGGSNDVYSVDADTKLPRVFLDESGGGSDTLDFSLTTTQGVLIDLRSSFLQTVNANLAVQLKNPTAFENVIGGSRNDSLIGNSNANVLVGGPGDDYLDGQAGNDLVIGGLGLDQLNGGANDDIVIAGRTTLDGNINGLNELIAEWKSTATFTTRVARLRSGVGASRASLIAKSTVLNDTTSGDRIYGGTGQDWFFRSREEIVTDQVFGEIIEIL